MSRVSFEVPVVCSACGTAWGVLCPGIDFIGLPAINREEGWNWREIGGSNVSCLYASWIEGMGTEWRSEEGGGGGLIVLSCLYVS